MHFRNLKYRIITLSERSFIRDVCTYMTGTALSQLIIIVVAPILSRIYEPTDFAPYAVYASTVAIISVTCSMRYEFAIVLPKNDEDARALFYLSFYIALLITIICALFIMCIQSFGANSRIGTLGGWAWWLPISVLAVGIYQIMFYWSTRRGNFKRLSVSRVYNSIGLCSSQVVGGYTKLGANGLIGGQIIGQFIALFVLGFQLLRDDGAFLKIRPKYIELKEVAKKFCNFPMYNAPQSLINAFSQNIPILLLASYFLPEVVAYYMFAHRILNLPVSLIAESSRQVFYSKATKLFNEGKDVSLFLRQLTIGLFLVGVLPTVILILIAPQIFSWVLGSQWLIAGEYARYMAIWLFIIFLKAPFLAMVNILSLQRFNLYYEIIGLICRIVVIVIAGLYGSSICAIIGYSAVGSITNTFFIIYIYSKTKQHYKEKGVY